MQPLVYTNRILTVLTVLLTLNLYVVFTSGAPTISSVAEAAPSSQKGVGSQAARQAEMTKILRELAQKVGQVEAKLGDGSVRVHVENFPKSD